MSTYYLEYRLNFEETPGDPALIENLTAILIAYFSNGFRINSPIERERFKHFANKDLGKKLTLGDEELQQYITACGTVFNGKVYTVSLADKEKIKTAADTYFETGAQVLFYEEFYTKHEHWLFDAHIVSKDMLANLFRRLFPQCTFKRAFFGYSNGSANEAIKGEILRVWGDNTVLNYTQIAERLTYIPIERIKDALCQNEDFIWNNKETFTHISKFKITPEACKAVQERTKTRCKAQGYMAITDLLSAEIGEHNYELSKSAIQSALYQVCLSGAYTMKGKILTPKGKTLDLPAIMKAHFSKVEKCSLDDLYAYEWELTGEKHPRLSLETGYALMVRIDKHNFVSDRRIRFTIKATDKAIAQVVTGDYAPLKVFTTFAVFPNCGQRWNLFLLESYCRRFSKQFRFDAPSVNSRNAGAVIQKTCEMTYTEIMADAVKRAALPLEAKVIGKFLFDRGYTGKNTSTKIDEIIERIKVQPERNA